MGRKKQQSNGENAEHQSDLSSSHGSGQILLFGAKRQGKWAGIGNAKESGQAHLRIRQEAEIVTMAQVLIPLHEPLSLYVGKEQKRKIEALGSRVTIYKARWCP